MKMIAGLKGDSLPPGLGPLLPRVATDGQGRMVHELLECARRCFAAAGSAWLGVSTYLEGKTDRQSKVPDEILVLVDCAEVCEATARSLIRHSPERRLMCTFTAELCERAAEIAEQEPDLEMVVTPALRCARSCRSIAEDA